MEYLVTMTPHVPEGTPEQTVGDVRGREAAHSPELADEGHLERLWVLPGPGRALRRWQALDAAAMETIVRVAPPGRLDAWTTTQITPLSAHPSNPVITGSGAETTGRRRSAQRRGVGPTAWPSIPTSHAVTSMSASRLTRAA
jgi:muconolactone D-isomerase